MIRTRQIAIHLFLFGALLACRQGDQAAGGDTTESMLYSGAGDIAEPAPPLSDGNILALLDRASLTDSAAGALAVGKASSSELRAFAREMVRDHHAMRREAERVARRLRITPELPPGDESEAEMEAILALLNGAARGRDFDKAYVDHEVTYHLDVLEVATSAMELARETEVRSYIQRLAPMLRNHLDKAQLLQAGLR